MRRAVALLLGTLWLTGCGPIGSHARISKDTAITTALADVQALERVRARQVNQPAVSGFAMTRAYTTTRTASVTDARGDVVTANPSPREAWVIEFTAPPQGIWASISALEEVDVSSGVAVAGGLWAVPVGAPTKGLEQTPTFP